MAADEVEALLAPSKLALLHVFDLKASATNGVDFLEAGITLQIFQVVGNLAVGVLFVDGAARQFSEQRRIGDDADVGNSILAGGRESDLGVELPWRLANTASDVMAIKIEIFIIFNSLSLLVKA